MAEHDTPPETGERQRWESDDAQNRLAYAIRVAIRRARHEDDLTSADIMGVIEMTKLNLYIEITKPDPDPDPDDDGEGWKVKSNG